jgi:hypothetical protein
MGREEVQGALKPVSIATSDQKVRRTANTERRPRPQINALVDLGLTGLPERSKVFLEI